MSLIAARPLAQLQDDRSTSIPDPVLRLSPFSALDKLPPEVLHLIWSFIGHLDKFVALCHASSVIAIHEKRSPPRWTSVQVKPGMTLYMTFTRFKGFDYLTGLDDVDPAPGQSQMLKVQDMLIVGRDHFGIRGLYRDSNQIRQREPGMFFHTVPLQKVGTKNMKLYGFSDVSTERQPHDLPNFDRASSSET
jgi:hypothetical protein